MEISGYVSKTDLTLVVRFDPSIRDSTMRQGYSQCVLKIKKTYSPNLPFVVCLASKLQPEVQIPYPRPNVSPETVARGWAHCTREFRQTYSPNTGFRRTTSSESRSNISQGSNITRPQVPGTFNYMKYLLRPHEPRILVDDRPSETLLAKLIRPVPSVVIR